MGDLLARAWDAWCRFWFREQPPHALAIFRVLLGLFLLVYWGLFGPHLAFLFTNDGIALPMYAPPAGGWSGVRGPGDLLGMLTLPVPFAVTAALYAALIAALVLFTLGWWARSAAALHFLLYVYFYHLSLYSLNASFDRLFLQVSLLMCFARSAEVLSLEAGWRRRRGLASRARIPYWPARVIAVQGMLVYFGTGLHKTLDPEWWGGEVLYYNFINYWGSPLAFWIARQVDWLPIYAAFVWFTIVFELSAPVGLWWRRAQPYYFFVGFCFHTSISLTLQIWQFMAVPATYFLYVDPERVERDVEALRGWLSRGRPPG